VFFYIFQLKYCSKSSLSSSNLNNLPSFLSIASTSSTILVDTLFQYKCSFFTISLFPIAHFTISAIRFEFIGGAIIFVQAKIVSVLSEPNLTVTQGTQTIFASSCIDQESVTTAQALLIISITSAW
jgi:hypothetical protein